MRICRLAIVFLIACGSDSSGPAVDTLSEVSPQDTDPLDTDTADTLESEVEAPDTNLSDTPDTVVSWPDTIGGARPARVLRPSSYAGERLFAIVLLGGYDYFAADLDDWLELSAAQAERPFLLVLPDGLVDEDGSPFWNATDTCCDYYGEGVDDVAYLTGLFDELEDVYPVSGIGLVGHSAGGFMAYRIACEVPARISGVVSIAGSGFLDPEDCAVTDVPLPVLQVHGDSDDIMPFDGDDEAPGALEMLERWGETNGCRLRSWVTDTITPALAEEGETEVGTYRDDCAEDVRLWTLSGSDHYPTFSDAFVPASLDWLLSR